MTQAIIPTNLPANRMLSSPPANPVSPELAAELNRIETSEQIERDRRAQEELARLRDLARFD